MILNCTIKKPINEVYACFSDMQKFAEHHPVIYKTELLNKNEYQFYECIKFWGIPFKFKYIVYILDYKENEFVKMYSPVQKGVHLTLDFILHSDGQMTTIKEVVDVKAPFIIKGIFQSILKKAHQKLVDNIEYS